jgi:ribose transport system permease protein
MRRPETRINLGFDRFSGLYLWALFIVVFAIWVPTSFLTVATVHSIASQQAVAGMIALAVLVPIICGHYDLSVGGNANLSGIAAVLFQVQLHWSLPLAIIVAVLVGAAVGSVNALIVVRFQVSSFIATLGMGSILSAVLIIATGNSQPQPVVSSAWDDLTQTTLGGFQIVVVYLLILALILWWFLEHTPVGRYFYAAGGNPDAARLSGVRVDRWSASSLILSGGIAGLAGVLFTSQTGPSLTFGSTLLLPAFAAVFLGSTQLQPGRFNVWGALIAIYVLATGVQGLQLASGQQWLSDMFDGVALILAVAMAVSRQRTNRSGGVSRRRQRDTLPPTEVRSEDGLPPAFLEPREGLTALAEDADAEAPAGASPVLKAGTPEDPL